VVADIVSEESGGGGDGDGWTGLYGMHSEV
jgi:hypothetical protein